jgi:DNA repair exonuclease SbcCD ATPase subunit
VRLNRLKVSGFRGLVSGQDFDLDGDAVIVVGANGQGKTSLFDAILWGLTGRVPRLGDDPDVVSLYSESGEARVEIALRGEDGEIVRLIRSCGGGREDFSFHQAEEVHRDGAGEARLHKALWPEAAFAPDAVAALTTSITRSVYLQQDVVRQFIDGDTAQQRFAAVSELVGAGRVTELALSLESQKKSWTGATNRLEEDLRGAEARLASSQARLDELTAADGGDGGEDAAAWHEWWHRAEDLEVVEDEPPEFGSGESPAALDAAVKRLEALRLAMTRRIGAAEELSTEIATRGAPPDRTTDIETLKGQMAERERRDRELRGALAQLEAEAAERRRRQVERRERAEELRALAELALRHTEGPCPVCTQEHDQDQTRRHLEQLLEEGTEAPEAPDGAETISRLAAELQRGETEAAGARTDLAEIERGMREWQSWLAERDQRLAELGITQRDNEDAGRLLAGFAQAARVKRDEVDALEADGERISLQLARAGERARRSELAARVDSLAAEVASMSETVEARRATGGRAATILEALREASSDVVTEQLRRVEPLLRRIYAMADPHPSLRDVRFALSSSRGRGHLDTRLDDSLRTVSASTPKTILSSSQLNALAVSVFLALNLGVPSIPLGAAILDDPLQSLDDVNLLGLIDLLRRTKARRQLVISTHDHRFGALLARKLRPTEDGRRTCLIELNGWGRLGPKVTQSVVPMDTEILRIAA